MPASTDKPARDSNGKWLPGSSGNPKGREPDVREVREALISNAPALIKVVMEKALEGDMTAARLWLERISAPVKARSLPVPLMPEDADVQPADYVDVITRAAVSGQLSPDDAVALTSTLASAARVKETAELEERIRRLEESLNGHK